MNTTVQQWLDTPNNSEFNADIDEFNRQAQKDNSEHFEEYVPRKYETVLQENGRWIIRRAQQGLFGMIFILIFPGCGTMQGARDRAAFQLHAENVGIQASELEQYHRQLEDIKQRLDSKEKELNQYRADPNQKLFTPLTSDPPCGLSLLERGSTIDYEIYRLKKVRNHIERRAEAVEYFIAYPRELKRKIALYNQILADVDDQTFHKWTKDCEEYIHESAEPVLVPKSNPKTYVPPMLPTTRPPRPITQTSLNVSDEHTETAVELYKSLEKIDSNRVPLYNAVLR